MEVENHELKYAEVSVPGERIPGRLVGEKKAPFLYIPRKKVRLRRPCTKNENVWFIQERLENMADSLDIPTSLSHEGLPSGKRCAIIKTDDGRYLKLKGVAPNPNLTHSEDVWGSCSYNEGRLESFFLKIFRGIPDFMPLKPVFIEKVPFPNLENKRKFITKKYLKRKVKLGATFSEIDHAKQNERVMEAKGHFSHVFGMEIVGDTRLDEIVYYLTRREHSGEEKQSRDRLLSYLFYQSGVQKAIMSVLGFSWGNDLKNSNAHWGNFIVYPNSRNEVECCFTDFSSLKDRYWFSTDKEFFDYLEDELHALKWDINDPTTCSTSGYMKFRHFSPELREECFAALETGYKSFLKSFAKESNDLRWTPRGIERVVYPEDRAISDDEFRSELKRLGALD